MFHDNLPGFSIKNVPPIGPKSLHRILFTAFVGNVFVLVKASSACGIHMDVLSWQRAMKCLESPMAKTVPKEPSNNHIGDPYMSHSLNSWYPP